MVNRIAVGSLPIGVSRSLPRVDSERRSTNDSRGFRLFFTGPKKINIPTARHENAATPRKVGIANFRSKDRDSSDGIVSIPRRRYGYFNLLCADRELRHLDDFSTWIPGEQTGLYYQ